MSHAPALLRYALRYDGAGGEHFVLTLTAQELDRLAFADPLAADAHGNLVGTVRPASRAHVQALALAAPYGLIGSVLVELPPEISVKEQGYARNGEPARPVTLVIPLSARLLLLDGHHRVQALVQAEQFDTPVPFVADRTQSPRTRRSLHARANLTLPLRAADLADLVPSVAAPLPPSLDARKTALGLASALARLPESPFHARIRLPSVPAVSAPVSQGALERAIRRSLDSPSGCLFPLRNLATGEDDADAMLALLVTFWGAVAHAFPDAWASPVAESTLVSPAGIAALARLMDASMSARAPSDPELDAHARAAVTAVQPLCRWTSGRWDILGGVAWNELGTLPDHDRRLAAAFVDAYRRSPRPASP